MAPSQRYVRGIFSGGTFCFEAQLIHALGRHRLLLQHADGGQQAARRRPRYSREHTIIDMGDDEFTQGRPHPMIDPTQRDAADPRRAGRPGRPRSSCSTWCSATAPPSTRWPGCSASSTGAGRRGRPQAARSRFIGYVCGTDLDPQDRGQHRRRPGGRRRAGRLDQRRSRRLVGHADRRSGRQEHRREDACSQKTSGSSTSACRASPTTSPPPAAR